MIFKWTRFINIQTSRVIWTTVCRINSALRGVSLGRKNLFYGFTRVYLEPGSSITTGYKCIFNSKSSYNFLGINHGCMISTINPDSIIEIGDNCAFSGAVIVAHKSIKIGKRLKCGANVIINDSDWHPEDPRSRGHADVVIGNDVWLGMNTVILKGVTIGENAVIGANSVVSKSIPANCIAAGNPCRVIREIEVKHK